MLGLLLSSNVLGSRGVNRKLMFGALLLVLGARTASLGLLCLAGERMFT